MSILPWGNWFFHISTLQDQGTDLHDQATDTANSINSQITDYENEIPNYRSLLLINSALVLMNSELTIDDEQYINLTKAFDDLPDEAPAVSSTVVDIISTVVSFPEFIKGVYNLGSLVKRNLLSDSEVASSTAEDLEAVDSAAEGAAESATAMSEATTAAAEAAETATEGAVEAAAEVAEEVAAEAVVETASLSTVAAFGIGIIALFAVDAIFGTVDGAKEKKELDESITDLNQILEGLTTSQETLNGEVATLEEGLASEEQRFLGIIDGLKTVVPGDNGLDLSFEPTAENADQFVAIGGSAITYYSDYVNFKRDWFTAKENDPDLTKEVFLQTENLFSFEAITGEEAAGYWDVLETYSSSMSG